jgi:hypothetical protein
MIIEQTYNLIRENYDATFPDMVIEDARVGQYLTAVKLSDGSAGVASSLAASHPFCTKEERDFGEFTPLRMKGRKITDLFQTNNSSNLIYSLRTAVLNAVSSK